jgi:hypothetical protein
MKKTISTMALVTVMTLGSAGVASALTINGGAIEVGGLDTLILAEVVDPDDATEAAWISLHTGLELDGDDIVKLETLDWTAVDGETNVYAHELTIMPSHYLIKTGEPYGSYTFLFANNESYNWAVIDLAVFAPYWTGLGDSAYNIGALSHISQVDPIPEPATMLLFGAGLAGLAGLGLRRRKTEA